MNAIARYRTAAEFRREGVSEERIAIRMGVRQWTVSRLLALRTLDEDIARMFDGEDRISLSALTELAGWPAEHQALVLRDLRKLAADGKTLRRRDVLRALVWKVRDLDRAPFPSSACARCAKRTGAQADLFGMVSGLGRCLDAKCFARMMNAVKARGARWRGKGSTGDAASSEKE